MPQGCSIKSLYRILYLHGSKINVGKPVHIETELFIRYNISSNQNEIYKAICTCFAKIYSSKIVGMFYLKTVDEQTYNS